MEVVVDVDVVAPAVYLLIFMIEQLEGLVLASVVLEVVVVLVVAPVVLVLLLSCKNLDLFWLVFRI